MPFLWKILQNLARHRLIRSFKGIRGGYELAIPAEKITLRMIVNPLEGIERMNDCILGLAECSEENACPLHETWRELRSQLSSMLEEKNLAELARVAQRRNADVPA